MALPLAPGPPPVLPLAPVQRLTAVARRRSKVLLQAVEAGSGEGWAWTDLLAVQCGGHGGARPIPKPLRPLGEAELKRQPVPHYPRERNPLPVSTRSSSPAG